MHDYTAYGLTIRSELLLPELVEASALEMASTPRPKGELDVSIVLAPANSVHATDSRPTGSAWATPDTAFLQYPGTATFLIQDGRRISIDADARADHRLIRLFLLGPVLALLLHQRKFLVIHASAVSLGGEAIAFVGEKGMGKSTMAAALHARGHALVADDLVAVDTTADRPLAYPGFPQLKLFPESAALLSGDPALLPKVHPEFEKRARRAIEGFPTHSLPLRQIFVLADGEVEAIEPLTAGAGFMELVRHSYLLGWINATKTAAMHFRQATTLASRVPVARLIRRRSLHELSRVAELVEGELERAA